MSHMVVKGNSHFTAGISGTDWTNTCEYSYQDAKISFLTISGFATFSSIQEDAIVIKETWSALVSLSWDSTTLGTASVLIDLLGDLLGREDLNLKADSSNVAAIRASAVTVGKEATEYGTAPCLACLQGSSAHHVVAKTGLLYCAVWRFQGKLALGAFLHLLCTALQKLELDVGEHDSKYLEIGTLLVKKAGELIPALAQAALVSHKPFGDASSIPSVLRHKFLVSPSASLSN
ncbi:unnamed protein product [Sphagnum balticum]